MKTNTSILRVMEHELGLARQRALSAASSASSFGHYDDCGPEYESDYRAARAVVEYLEGLLPRLRDRAEATSDATVIEEGVTIVKDGKFWGDQWDDGKSSHSDFGDAKKAKIADPLYAKEPSDFTWEASSYHRRLNEGRLVKVRRTTTIEIIE